MDYEVTAGQKRELLQKEFLQSGFGPNDSIGFEKLKDILRSKGVSSDNIRVPGTQKKSLMSFSQR